MRDEIDADAAVITVAGQPVRGSVLRTIIHNENLTVLAALIQNRAKALIQIGFTVISRNNDRQQRSFFLHGKGSLSQIS